LEPLYFLRFGATTSDPGCCALIFAATTTARLSSPELQNQIATAGRPSLLLFPLRGSLTVRDNTLTLTTAGMRAA
jgi:hypothetical protein